MRRTDLSSSFSEERLELKSIFCAPLFAVPNAGETVQAVWVVVSGVLAAEARLFGAAPPEKRA